MQATPNSVLASSLRKALENTRALDGGKTLVVEKGGRSIMAGLRNPDPYRILGCQYEDKCMIDPKQTCWQSKIVYSLTCTTCGAVYTGTSGLTAHKRGMEHLTAVRRGDTSYAMGKHYVQTHPDWPRTTAPFILSILRTPRLVGNLQRYIAEALKIREAVQGPVEHLNSKGEWARVALKRQGIIED